MPELIEKRTNDNIYESNEISVESSSNELEKQSSIEDVQIERTTWANDLDFFLSALGYAVGIGNVWRFPYMCYKNGGGVFLIPYFTCMFVLGMPIVYLEFIVGQFRSSGALNAYRMIPLFRGIGLTMNLANSFRLIFFNMVIAYALYFFIGSFTTELPWQKCNPEWASPNCVDDFSSDKFTYTNCTGNYLRCEIEGTENFGRCFNRISINGTLAHCSMNRNHLVQIGFWKTAFPSADYWRKIVLQQSESIDEPGKLIWQLSLCYFGIYFIVYLMLIKGIKVSGKAMYFTALFPYFILLILGIRGWILPGAGVGIRYYLFPKWEKLYEIRVWADAATAIFFSLGLSFGGMTTLASYNKFKINIMKDAVIIPLANCLTSFFAGFVIFAYMGYLSHITGQDIDNIIEAGQGLAFVVYPFAVTTLAGAPLWALLFFFMLILLGIGSHAGNLEITITSIMDSFPLFCRTKLRKYVTITALFIIYFLLGLFLFCRQAGTYWVEVFNTYTGDWAILLNGATICLTASYLYGIRNLKIDIEAMLGPKYTKGKIFNISCTLWSFVSPLLCITIIFQTFREVDNIRVGNYRYPDWTLYFGQFMQFNVIIFGIFSFGVYELFKILLIERKPLISLILPDFENHKPKLISNQKIVRDLRELQNNF